MFKGDFERVAPAQKYDSQGNNLDKLYEEYIRESYAAQQSRESNDSTSRGPRIEPVFEGDPLKLSNNIPVNVLIDLFNEDFGRSIYDEQSKKRVPVTEPAYGEEYTIPLLIQMIQQFLHAQTYTKVL